MRNNQTFTDEVSMKVKAVLLAVVFSIGGFGCGGEGDEGNNPPNVQKRELPQPMLRMVAPTAIRAGEVMKIFGKGFADKAVGRTTVIFEGIYQTTSGKIEQVKLNLTPVYQNQE